MSTLPGQRLQLSPLERRRELFRGCLLGGAAGDALGAPVEFLSLDEICELYGTEGIRAPDEAYGRVGAITDDTQMTLFTAEGLLRAHNRWLEKGITDVPGVVGHAYQRWLYTQGYRDAGRMLRDGGPIPDGWLIGVGELHSRRAPGRTCLTALEQDRLGEIDRPLNDSKGCGAVMRAAPVGLLIENDPFRTGCEIGALTHGHPTGYTAAGALGLIVHRLTRGATLDDALDECVGRLRETQGGDECASALVGAISAAREGSPTAERVESLGAGWVAEEALAIAVYCALVAGALPAGIRLAVNHSGDSDSTGAIAGNLLGAIHGESSLPPQWLEQLELRDVIAQVADDLALHLELGAETADWERYPGW
jgi:ADP-ribosylglycohydrolase